MADESDTPLEPTTPTTPTMPDSPPPPDDPPPSDPPTQDDPPEPKTDAEIMQARLDGQGKLLERLAQEISQLNRNANKQGGELTAVQEAKRQEAQAEIVRLQKELGTFSEANPGDEGIDQKLTKVVLAQAKKIEALEAQAQAAQPSEEQEWTGVQKGYPNMSIKELQELWTKTVPELQKSYVVQNSAARLRAGKIDQETFDSIHQGACSDLFHQRAQAANKAKKLPTASAPPPAPPGGGRSVPMRGGQTNVPAAQPEDPMIAFYKKIDQDIERKKKQAR